MSPSPLLCRCKSSSRQCFPAFKILSSATIIRQDELCHPPVHGLHFRIVVNSADWVLRWCDKYFRFTLKISLFADLRGNQLMALLLRRQAKLHGVSGWLDTCYGAHVCSCPTTRINLGTIIQISTQLWPFTVDLKLSPPPSLIMTKPLEKRDVMMCKLKKNDSSRRSLAVHRLFFFLDIIPRFMKHFLMMKE